MGKFNYKEQYGVIILCRDERQQREFYERDVIPAMARTLERCLKGLQSGIKRRIPQVGKYATFDNMIK